MRTNDRPRSSSSVTPVIATASSSDVHALAERVGAWRVLVNETPLQPHARHRFTELEQRSPATHVRLNIYPDGGIARMRAYGIPGSA